MAMQLILWLKKLLTVNCFIYDTYRGERLMSNVAKHPVLVFGLESRSHGYRGFIKYRKEIISAPPSCGCRQKILYYTKRKS